MALFKKKQAQEPQGMPQPPQVMPQTQMTAPPRRRRLLSYQLANLQGIGARARQEDSFTTANAFDVTEIRENGLLFVVCDGMGGMKDGKVASETAIASIRSSFLEMDRSANLAAQLEAAVYRAADAVEGRLGGDGGSTIVAGIIFREQLFYASVGDSYFYLKRGNGLYRLNREHNLCNQIHMENIRAGKLDPEEGRRSPEAVALTQFLGMTGMDDVDCSARPLPLKEGDVLVACSDGVGGVLDEDEMYRALMLEEAQEMCRCMEQGIIAHARRNQDNYTALVVRCMY
jgi:protein phosphatase